MILIDFSQVSIGNLHQQLKQNTTTFPSEQPNPVQPMLLRHMILNSIRKINKDFGREYGKVVVCTDNHNYWRKLYFKPYKANRKKDRDESGIDWPLVFHTLNELRSELRDFFPYRVMDVKMAEADDIIGVIAKHFHSQEKILIISGDHDFAQLQVYPNVQQYSPIKDQFLTTADPIRSLKEHIMRGDKGDGIPNFLSEDDVFLNGVRQSPVRGAKVDLWLTQSPEDFCDDRMLRNYRRNEKLVDLSQIPSDIENAILEQFQQPIHERKDMIYSYLVKNRLKNLLDSIQEF